MWSIIIPAITGIITGAIASLFAPWANWGIEKKRLRQTARAKLFEDGRAILSDPPQSNVEMKTKPLNLPVGG